METYYQKHRTIKAFQFDGNWATLMQELPPAIATKIIEDVNYAVISKRPQWQRMKDGRINHFISTISKWHYDAHQKKIQHLGVMGPKTLQIGDYVLIKPLIECNKGYIWQPIHIHTHHQHWSLRIRLRFMNAKDFEAHWSKTPIKKR